MVNMPHCRFRNTLEAMRECEEYIDEHFGDLSELNDEEAEAAKELISLCVKISTYK